MTDRAQAFLVHLDDDYRLGTDEHGKAILNALRMVKGVVKVEPVPVDLDAVLARERAVAALRQQLREVLWP